MNERKGKACRVALVSDNTKLLHIRYFSPPELVGLAVDKVYWLTGVPGAFSGYECEPYLYQIEEGTFVTRPLDDEAQRLGISSKELNDVLTGVWHNMNCRGTTLFPITFYVEDY